MMNTRNEIDEMLQSCDMSSLFADGFDDAIIGGGSGWPHWFIPCML